MELHTGSRGVSPGSSKAQLSVETLLVFLVFLIILGIAYTASTRLYSASQQGINAALSRESFNELSSKIEEACLLGSGNVRIVKIKGQPVSLSAEGRALAFFAPGFSATYDSPCGISIDQEKSMPSAAFTIENSGGAIRIS